MLTTSKIFHSSGFLIAATVVKIPAKPSSFVVESSAHRNSPVTLF